MKEEDPNAGVYGGRIGQTKFFNNKKKVLLQQDNHKTKKKEPKEDQGKAKLGARLTKQ